MKKKSPMKPKKVRKNNMGNGSWTRDSFRSYSKSMGRSVDNTGSVSGNYHAQDMFKQRKIAPELNPLNAIRECCDTKEHPNTIPVILGIDVTASMGGASVEVAKKVNVVMTRLYEEVKDVEFMIMGIGDLKYDRAPLQASQFESDIRIAEQLDKIYFEGGGGGNSYESYTVAWYFGLRHTKLDCWKRGKRGIIITMGDETLNPYLPIHGEYCGLSDVTGDKLQADVETDELYKEAIEKYDIYHLAVKDRETSYSLYDNAINSSFGKYLDEQHFRVVGMDNIANTIIDIVVNTSRQNQGIHKSENSDGMISW